MASSLVNLKALGLNYSPNNLDLPEGSLVVAENVVVRRDNVISQRRGIKDYSEQFNETVKQLIQYRSTVLAHVGNTLKYDTKLLNADGESIFDDFNGSVQETQAGLRIKSISGNRNLYFTTSNGVKKISARSSLDFNNAADIIQPAGGVKAIDFSAVLDVQQGQTSGFLPADGAVGYRVVWGYKDRNDNLILGVPSERTVVYNFLQDLIPDDLNTLLLALDNLNQTGSLITDGTYFQDNSVPLNATASALQTAVIGMATQLDENIEYSPSLLTISQVSVSPSGTARIEFSSGDPTLYISTGDKIRCTGFDASSTLQNALNNDDVNKFWTITDVQSTYIEFVVNDAQTFTAVAPAGSPVIESYNYRFITESGDSTFTAPLSSLTITVFPTSEQLRIIQNTISRIQSRLLVEKVDVIPAILKTNYLEGYSITEAANVTLTINIPSGIFKTDGVSTDYFVQIYRTRNFVAQGVQSLGPGGFIPVEPDDEMRLVFETFPTANDIAVNTVTYFDNYPEDLAITNANLYTNPVTGEGILQANDIPPFAKDINRFKNVTFYANTKTKQRLNPFQLIGTSGLLASTTKKLTIGVNDLTSSITYQFVSGVQQIVEFEFDAANAADLKSAFDGKFFNINTPTRKFYIWFNYDGVTPVPTFPSSDAIIVQVDLLTTDTIAQAAQKLTNTINSVSYDFAAVLVSTTPPTLQFICTDQGIADAPEANGTPGNDIDVTFLTTYSLSVTTVGDGEDANSSPPKVLLVDDLNSPTPITRAQAIDETARSLVKVINKQANSPVYAYYISGDNVSPGVINLEAKNLNSSNFYVIGSDEDVGTSFNPDISPVYVSSGAGTIIAGAGTAVIPQPSGNSLINGDKIIITGSNSTPVIDGIYTVLNAGATTFEVTVPSPITSAGTYIAYSKLSDSIISDNEERVNRVYYSKINQPEAVPLLNFFDLGSSTKEILRIFPLRDSLFVFKEDGLFRISGESAPFVTGLFDTSCVLLAPDSLGVANNIIYGWTVKGISTITESGVVEVSRPIDIEIFKLSSSGFKNFKSITWGLGYDSDNSYTVYTNAKPSDLYPTVGFRFDNQTNTWTNIVRPQNCGVLFDDEDRLYLGNAETNSVDQERKSFTRTDFADKDFIKILSGNNAVQDNGKKLVFSTVVDIEPGDVVVQEQLVTIDIFNNLLLKLDTDQGLNETDFYSTLALSTGSNLRDAIVALATKLTVNPNTTITYTNEVATIVGDIISVTPGTTTTTFLTSTSLNLLPGRIITFTVNNQSALADLNVDLNGLTFEVVSYNTSTNELVVQLASTVIQGPSAISLSVGDLTFSTEPNHLNPKDIATCYNSIIENLNSDSGITFSNYLPFNGETSIVEVVVDSVNITKRFIELNLALQWVIGNVTIFKAIPYKFQYAPITFGNALLWKQIFQNTIMFESQAFTRAEVGFSSDLKPEILYTKINGIGNGIFGHYSDPGFGYGFFGGGANNTPFRTMLPRPVQRCRFINLQVRHRVAREIINIFGATLTGNLSSTDRAYK